MNILNYLLDFVFPPKCIFCSRILPHGEGEYICSECIDKMVFCERRICCAVCGKPQISVGEKGMCYSCLSKTHRSYKRAVAVVKYDELVSKGVKRFKDGYCEIAGEVMAKAMAERARIEYAGVKLDMIVGVAPSKIRNTKRGYDPVSVICKNVSKLSGIPYHRNVLVKIKHTPKQSGLDYEHRIKNLIGAIGISKGANVSGKKILLIDDVMTTGATIDECAYVLKREGAKMVCALTYATTIKEPKTYKN